MKVRANLHLLTPSGVQGVQGQQKVQTMNEILLLMVVLKKVNSDGNDKTDAVYVCRFLTPPILLLSPMWDPCLSNISDNT